MHEFKSKPIKMSGDLVLCEDGSIWKFNVNSETWFQKAKYSPDEKQIVKKKKDNGYPNDFIEFWDVWTKNINNSCSKMDTFRKWKSLSKHEKQSAIDYIADYSKSNEDHQYLKRANTYLSNKIWESKDQISKVAKSVMPSLNNPAWDKEIFNQDTGITDKARIQVTTFGMSQDEAWRLVNES